MAVETDVAGLNMYSDISNLEAPVFSTIDRKPPAHLLKLNWDHQVNLVGKKVPNPMFHCCDTCRKPILIYGRMIPCKHVFCFSCAKQEDEKACPRCTDKVKKVEQCDLGTIFLCTSNGTRYGNNGCRRTYLSSRDLQAHIKHRHATKAEVEERSASERKEPLSKNDAIRNAVNSLSKASLEAAVAAAKAANSVSSSSTASAYGGNNSAINSLQSGTQRGSANTSYPGTAANQSGAAYSAAGTYRPGAGGASSTNSSTAQISVLNSSRSSNLITIPIHAQGGSVESAAANSYPPGGTYPGYTPAPYTAQYPGNTVPTTIGYTQGTHSSYSQPPPSAYSYSGGYGAPVPGQYPSTGAVAPGATSVGSYPPGASVGAGQQAGVQPYQPHFNRPPPTGIRPVGGAGSGGSRHPSGPRQPPPSGGQPGQQSQNYYRR